MIILGVSCGHDAGCCIVRDGVVVADAPEERFSRIKHNTGVPGRSLAYCLDAAGLSDINEVDYIAVGSQQLPPNLAAFFGLRSELREGARRLEPPIYLQHFYLRDPTKLRLVEHHLAHAASAHYTRSSAEPCLVFTLDGAGDDVCTAVWQAENSTIVPLQKLGPEAPIGWAYSGVTEALGWWHGDGEGKTMGLAPYGSASNCTGVLDTYFPEITAGCVSRAGQVGTPHYWYECATVHWHLGAALEIQTLLNGHDAADIAAEAQRKLEECVLAYVYHWIETTGIKRTAYAGGVFLNVKLNQRIWNARRDRLVEQHVFPNPGDAGLALGAALHTYYRDQTFTGAGLTSISWGPEYSDDYIENLLRTCKIAYERVSDPSARAADLLMKQLIVGWFQGRMESGPRSLGNRSILMAPAPAANKDRINATVKFREPFRPFCPSILWEKRSEYMIDSRDESFMITSFDVNPEYRDRLAAVTHVDGTVRPQMVRRDVNERFWRLIECFGDRTGVFAVLNTSMNLKGEPIVNTPNEALRFFVDSGIDALVLGSFLVEKASVSNAAFA